MEENEEVVEIAILKTEIKIIKETLKEIKGNQSKAAWLIFGTLITSIISILERLG